jgi:hypothetical protein
MSYSVVSVKTKRLTKSFYLKLTAGLYLVSADCTRTGEPVFEGIVVVEQMREKQWREIKKAGADYRKCRVFRSRAQFESFRALVCSEELTRLLNSMASSSARNN